MKKYLFAALILTAAASNAQTKQGTIIYERKVDVYRRMKDEQMKAMVPQFQTTKSELVFNDRVSVYRAVTEDNAPDPFNTSSGGATFVLKIGGPGDNSILYKNFETQKFLEQTELADKDYIIDDSIHKQEWKLTEETMTILDHVCKKATVKTERGNDVTAWYAEDIPSPVGPDAFSGLPGAILMIDVNNGEMIYTATEFKKDADDKALAEPTKGKRITRADFNKKLDEMFGPPSPDGRRMVIQN